MIEMSMKYRRKEMVDLPKKRIVPLAIAAGLILAATIGHLLARHQVNENKSEEQLQQVNAAVLTDRDTEDLLDGGMMDYECCGTQGPTAEPVPEKTPEVQVVTGEPIWTGWTYYESGDAGWEQVGGDEGNAFGRFQLDARHSLPAFLRYAAESDERFVGLERYYRKGREETTIKTLDGLPHDWQWLCAVYGEDFYRKQAEFAYGMFYLMMRDELLAQYDIDLNQYGPVLKGTVWSVAVRNGSNISSIYSVTDTYYPGITEEEWLREIYAVEEWRHTGQERRWGDQQLNAALKTLRKLENGKAKIYDTFEKGVEQDTERIELLTLEDDYRDFVCYTGRVFK